MLTAPSILLLLLAILFIVFLVAARIVSARFNEIDRHMKALYQALEEQSGALDSLHRSVQEAVEMLALPADTTQATGKRGGEADPIYTAGLRQELESLRSELMSDELSGPRGTEHP